MARLCLHRFVRQSERVWTSQLISKESQTKSDPFQSRSRARSFESNNPSLSGEQVVLRFNIEKIAPHQIEDASPYEIGGAILSETLQSASTNST
jgi:hypothetical protein